MKTAKSGLGKLDCVHNLFVSQTETRMGNFFFAAKPTFNNSVSVEPKGNIVKVGIHWSNEQRKESEYKIKLFWIFFDAHATTEHDWYESNH